MKSSVHTIDVYSDDENNQLFMGQVPTVNVHGCHANGDDKAWYTKMMINGLEVKIKLNTGATANVLPLSTYKQLKLKCKPDVKITKTILCVYGDTKVIS